MNYNCYVRHKPTSTLNSNEIDNTVENSNQYINIHFENSPSKLSLLPVFGKLNTNKIFFCSLSF